MKHIVTESMNIMDALRFLSPDSSNSTLRQWLKNGRIQVDGKTAKRTSHTLEKGQIVTLADKPRKKIRNLPIVYEDSDVIVIEKPAGLLSVSTDFDALNNAHALLKRHFNKRVYVIHRLDKETSGVMIFALSKPAMDNLKVQFANHTITRCYTALVEGSLQEKKGTWVTNIYEDANYKVHVTEGKGEQAISHYEVIDEGSGFSTLNVTLETGKKNQIRVHCQHAGHPVAGDFKYGAEEDPLKRLALHARLLAFDHPSTGKRMTFESTVPWKFRHHA